MTTELTQWTQILADLTLTAMLFIAWTWERQSHAETRKQLARTHARHKQDLRQPPSHTHETPVNTE